MLSFKVHFLEAVEVVENERVMTGEGSQVN